MSEQYFTPEEVAEKLRVKVTTVWEWIRSGKLKATRIVRQYRISAEDIEAFIER